MELIHILYSNLIGIPTTYFASAAFNLSPLPVQINSVREMNASFFKAMDALGPEELPPFFMDYLNTMFQLKAIPGVGEKRKYRANYIRILRGWFFDSNRPEGAVMKGWAESRFGLLPLFHKEPIPNVNTPAYWIYLTDKMHPRFHNNSVFSQLDLLYEFCQYYLSRFGPSVRNLTLYRGTNLGTQEHQVVEKREKKIWVIRNNNLVSYTSEKDRASEFGDVILEIKVPFEKIVCFPALLPGKISSSESEYILLGGDYLSRILDF